MSIIHPSGKTGTTQFWAKLLKNVERKSCATSWRLVPGAAPLTAALAKTTKTREESVRYTNISATPGVSTPRHFVTDWCGVSIYFPPSCCGHNSTGKWCTRSFRKESESLSTRIEDDARPRIITARNLFEICPTRKTPPTFKFTTTKRQTRFRFVVVGRIMFAAIKIGHVTNFIFHFCLVYGSVNCIFIVWRSFAILALMTVNKLQR